MDTRGRVTSVLYIDLLSCALLVHLVYFKVGSVVLLGLLCFFMGFGSS